MISSAVVIPEEQPSVAPNSPTSLKRRQSSLSTEPSKRPRVETHNGLDNGSATEQDSPNRRKSAAAPTSAVEEKKRGKRLFGALLGTLSQTSSKPAHRKRDEIEQRQRDRLKRDNEEREEEARRKKNDLDRIRRVEQKAWDAENTRIRHRNMKAMANFLQTKTEPRLYYRPWDLRPDEERQIKKQIEVVEDLIRSETDINQTNGKHDDLGKSLEIASPNDTAMNQQQQSESTSNDIQTREPSAQKSAEPDEMSEDRTVPPREDDQGGGELVEGREDDVMY